MRTAAGLLIIRLLTAPIRRGQAQPDLPKFAVASVKPTDLSLNQRIDMRVLPDGGVTATNVTLKFLIRVAYSVQDIQISGGPSWLDTEKYDILSKPEENAKRQLLPMLQSRLEDRFKLGVHRETKERPVYELKMAKPGDKFGPNLHELEAAPCPQGQPSPDAARSAPCGGFLVAKNRLIGSRATLSALANNLSNIADRPVLDKTAVTKQFDLDLYWTPDVGFVGRGDSIPTPDPAAPSFFAALQEQLELKLDAAKGPVEMLVIDQMERPSAN